jgi:hypothetical protein
VRGQIDPSARLIWIFEKLGRIWIFEKLGRAYDVRRPVAEPCAKSAV